MSLWDVDLGTNFREQFSGSTALTTLDVSAWNVGLGTDFYNFMSGASMTTTVYDQTLINWDALTLKPNETISFGASKYTSGSAAATARASMIANDGWTISDGGGSLAKPLLKFFNYNK